MKRNTLPFLAFFVLLFTTAACFANGGYKPTIEVAAPPTIPVQRALITFRDGVETLIVESTFQTPSKEVVWILPLPAEPTSLTKADSGLLETLSIQLQPKIVTRSETAQAIILAMFFFAIPLALIRLTKREPLLIPAVLALGLLTGSFALFVFMLPSLGRARASAGGGADTEPGVAILDSLRVGNYDSKVLRADSAGALGDYLAQHKLQPLSADEKKIFDQYIAEGWCFVLSQLHQETTGIPATPHPMCATFPVKAPIFPMRATAMAGSTTHVELFIAANGRAAAPGFETVVSQAVHSGRDYYRQSDTSVFRSNYGPMVSHPDLIGVLWDMCILTKLTADLTSAQMDRDVALKTLVYREPYYQSLYSTGVRDQWIIASVCVIGTFVLCWLSVTRAPLAPEAKRIRRNRIRGTLGCTAAICAGIYLFFPAIPTSTLPSGRSAYTRERQLDAAARTAVSEHKLDASLLQSPEKLVEILRPLVRNETLMNSYTGAEITFRRSPGNYDVYERSGQVFLNLLPLRGSSYSIMLPSPRADIPDASATAPAAE